MAALHVTIIPEDFKNAPRGFSAGTGKEGCVLQQALMRMFPQEDYIYVGHDRATIGELPNQRIYHIEDHKWGRETAEFSAERINYLSSKAKESLEEIPSVSLTLEPF